ncbi:MAG TPA: hypothetical protein VF459_13195 [Caulobacteraceae bacterium]
MLVEFETLGEVEVSNRVDHKIYDEATRAYAMRWLNDKAMNRVRTAQAHADYNAHSPADLAIHVQRAARAAMIAATAAIIAAIVSGGAAYLTLSRPAPPPAPIHQQLQSLTAPAKPPAGPPPHRHGHRHKAAIATHNTPAQ